METSSLASASRHLLFSCCLQYVFVLKDSRSTFGPPPISLYENTILSLPDGGYSDYPGLCPK